MQVEDKRSNLIAFFKAVITTQTGNLLIATGDGSGQWWEEYFFYPDELEQATDYALAQAERYNVYFSAHLFKTHDSHKNNAIPSRTIQADLDDAPLDTISLKPNILVETSPGRHQAYWLLENDIDLDILEIHSRNLTYSIPLCDRSGWPIGHRVRVPYTLNYKRPPDVHLITVVDASSDRVTLDKLETIPKVSSIVLERYDQEWLDSVSSIDPGIGPQEILEEIKKKGLPPKVYALYNIQQQDRSAYLWSLTCAAFRTGLDRDKVFWLAKHSPNNKFSDLRYHADLELAKDVLRAQEAVRNPTSDIKTQILNIRKSKLRPLEQRQLISRMVIERMRQEGVFLHTDENTQWYIRRDTGRPIQIARASEMLNMLMAIEYGLNQSEQEQRYVRHELEAYALNLPETGKLCAMSYFDGKHKENLFIHTGRNIILKVSPAGIEEVPQGHDGLIFPWNPFVEVFKPEYDPTFDWAAFLFKDSLKGMVDIPYDNATALLKVWIIFVLMRQAAIARPILAFIGAPGAGKSTLFRKIYTVLYGARRDLIGVSKVDDFDAAVARDCLVVLDGVDTFEHWLPDRLSLSASNTDIVKRKLYTDVDTVVMRRQAVLGLTSHNPSFTREDIADRMVIINFKRIPDNERIAEDDMVAEVVSHRNKIWGGIITDIQKVLSIPVPTSYPPFRIQDFARIGLWIAQGVGVAEQFSASITHVRDAQTKLIFDEDQLLVDALLRYVVKQNGHAPEWESPATLFVHLENMSSNPQGFQRKYKNAQVLSRKLIAFQEPLSKIMLVDQYFDNQRGSRLWKIGKKNANASIK